MAPNGDGANVAMYDGAELGKALAAHRDDIEAALAEYELALFPRAAEAAAVDILELCLGDNAPHSLVNFFTGHEQTPPICVEQFPAAGEDLLRGRTGSNEPAECLGECVREGDRGGRRA